MSDLITRLRTWSHARHAAPASDIMDEAADEIERLRQVSSQENMTYAERIGAANSQPDHREACGESRTGSVDAKAGEDVATCTVTSAKLPERDRLTDAEREAVEQAAEHAHQDALHGAAATLRGLLERMGE